MNDTPKTIEQQVAEAILQKATTTIQIGDTAYELAPPTPATLILISELVAGLPAINKNTTDILGETLRTARDSKAIGKIAATLILGAKRIREARTVTIATHRRWSWRRMRFVTTEETMPELDYVARAILEEVHTATLAQAIGSRLLDMQVGDFFGLTTSLSETNILKPTREVEPTASGASSSAGSRQ